MASINKKVMFLDGDNKVVVTAKKLLARENYQLLVSSDPDEALEVIDDKGPMAVVVCENKLSTMRGTEFFEKLKGLAPDTVRILMTAGTDAKLIEDVVNTGEVFRFVKKPLDFKILTRAIQEGVGENDRILKLKAQLGEHEKILTEKAELEAQTQNLDNQVQGLMQIKKKLVLAMVIMALGFGTFEAYSSWARNVKLESTSQKMGHWVKYDNGTAKDTKTDLVWMTRDFRIIEKRQPKDWQEAMSWVEKINEQRYGGYTDWRAPTIEDYQAIYNENGKQQAYDQKEKFLLGNPEAFESGGGYGFWSNEEMGMESARYFFFMGGYGVTELKGYNSPTLSIRLVRN
ncbi:MAG: hypothetical protein NPINA01_28420 [Nitrospinaceae bacterium]|nr:MAG: hypothetical protein NPINA01_28420 [Nitrospinaceae bacterium]